MLAPEDQSTNQKNPGKFKVGKELAKASLKTLWANKKMILLPGLSALVSFVALMIIVGAVIGAAFAAAMSGSSEQPGTIFNLITGLIFGLTFGVIGAFIEASMIKAALDAFSGKKVSIRASIKEAFRHKKALIGIGLISGVIGFILRTIEERLPFGIGVRIITFLFGAAWTAISFFSIPFILTENAGAIESTKKSAGLIKKIWGEGIISLIGIGLAQLAIFGIYMLTSAALWAGALIPDYGSGTTAFEAAMFIAAGLTTFFGFILVIGISASLSAVIKAAIFHYATTGEAPEQFSKDALKSAMTAKKARKLFA